MSRNALVVALSLVFGSLAVPLHAQNADSIQTVKELYAAAAYEDALAAVSRAQAERPDVEMEQYRAFALFALGRNAEANTAIERLMTVDPLYMPDATETSPRVREAFSQARQRVLPEVTKRMYGEAKAALERKDRGSAITGFEKLLKIIDTAAPASESLTELRLLAAGFLDLSRAIPEVPAGSETSAPAESAQAQPPPQSIRPTEGGITVPRPVAIKQDLPPWMPLDAISQQRDFTGELRVRVGVDGRVESAEMVKSVHPGYDVALLRAARSWLYEPARANGVAVASDLVIQVQLRPRP